MSDAMYIKFYFSRNMVNFRILTVHGDCTLGGDAAELVLGPHFIIAAVLLLYEGHGQVVVF